MVNTESSMANLEEAIDSVRGKEVFYIKYHDYGTSYDCSFWDNKERAIESAREDYKKGDGIKEISLVKQYGNKYDMIYTMDFEELKKHPIYKISEKGEEYY